MLNPSRSPNLALVKKGPVASQDEFVGIDFSLPEGISSELQPAFPLNGFRLERLDTRPRAQDNIRFHRICGRSMSGPSSAALLYIDDVRLQLEACTEAFFVYALCVRVCKKFKPGDADTLSLVVLTPEGTSCPRHWEQQVNDFKDIRAVTAAQFLSIPPPEQWSNAGVDMARQYIDEWTRSVGLTPLDDSARDLVPPAQRTVTPSVLGGAAVGEARDPDAPHVFISYAHADRQHCEELKTALAPLRIEGYRIWSDKSIDAGEGWEPAIRSALGAAQVIVMLASQRFIDSDFIARNELEPALDAARKGQKTIIWAKWDQCAVEAIGLTPIQAGHDIDTPLGELPHALRSAQLYKFYRNVKARLDEKRNTPKQRSDTELFGGK